ncbi:MAG: GNAT family N-acetyltransferase [Rubrivivax sp.]
MAEPGRQPSGELLENRFAGPALGSLFHSPEFFRMHAGEAGLYLEWAVQGQVQACIHFTRQEGGLWRSPGRGTFAGYAWSSTLPMDSLWAFHQAALQRLHDHGARQVQILTAPMAHDPLAFSQQSYLLRSTGFDITRCDLNQSIALDSRPLAERMSYGNLKRLRKCQREGVVAELLGPDALAAVVDTLAANRAAKGHSLSMTLDGLAQMQQRFPGQVFLYGAQAGDEQAAAAYCLRLTPQTLYVFYWGDRPGYAQLSPVVALADCIDRHARSLGVEHICVGTSTIDAAPNFGLLQFKRNLGFGESLKLQLTRILP